MTVRTGPLTSIFATGAAARGPPMKGFFGAGPDGRRAFRNRYARLGMPGLSVFFFPAGGAVPRCPAVCRGTPGRRHRRGGGIAGREEGFWAIPGCHAGHTGCEK
jgi:hypothetical protein